MTERTYCRRCLDTMASEFCWYCEEERLCYECWDLLGHCGHEAADLIDRLRREGRTQHMSIGEALALPVETLRRMVAGVR